MCNKHNTVKLISLRNYSAVNLAEALSKVYWYDVIKCENVNQVWIIFKHIFMSVVNGIAPIEIVRLKLRPHPWMDNEMLLAIRDIDNAMQNLKKLKSHENHKIYRLLRNKVHHKVHRKAKQNFVKDKIAQCRNSS